MACLTWSNRRGRLHWGSLSLPSWRFSPWGYGLLMKIREHISVFRATLASARCSDPHPRNSLLKVPSRMETPAAELNLFTSRSSFFFPRCEDPDELLCQLDTSLSSGAHGRESVTHGWLICSAALLSQSPTLLFETVQGDMSSGGTCEPARHGPHPPCAQGNGALPGIFGD